MLFKLRKRRLRGGLLQTGCLGMNWLARNQVCNATFYALSPFRRQQLASNKCKTYCLSPIQFSETTSELPGFCGSYFTEVCSPSRQECRLIQCRR